jgi:hypothetical protein
MPLFDDLKSRLHQAEAAGEAAVEHALAEAESDVMVFLDRLKTHTAQNPEPLFAVLRRVKPGTSFISVRCGGRRQAWASGASGCLTVFGGHGQV